MEEYQPMWLRSEEGEEAVDVLPLGANYYRLGSTLLTLGDEKEVRLYAGDVIEAEAQENGVLRFGRIIERSRWHHWEWLLSREVIESSAFENFQRTLVTHGGEWEQVMGGIFFAHLPEGSAFDPEAEIKKVLVEVAMSRERSEPNVAPPRQAWRDSTIQEENNRFPKGRWQWQSRPD